MKYYQTIVRLLLSLVLTILLLAATRATATPGAANPSATDVATSAVTLSNPAELEGFLDQVVTRQLAEHHIPGATIAVVKDGKVFFAKGYGYATIEQHTPIVADQTLFRVGSIAKLFTWTAVMQLVEQGKLDLNADVNSYLADFKIPATYPKPITLAHLMTHTAGFEDHQIGITVASAADLIPLGRYLADEMPERVLPPGTVTAYSNYGTTLAGYIVERVSGEPFAQYIEQHIFAPLAMRHSTFAQQLPSELAAQLAVSYDEYDGGFRSLPFEYFQIAPAGGLSTTATDMAQFMIAHLDDGRWGDTRILQTATAQDMHRQHFTNDLHVSGMAYGFAEMQLNGQQLLVHSGTTNNELFRSLLVLIPEQNTGLFVSYTGAAGGDAKWELLQTFLDRYTPAAIPVTPTPPSDFTQRAAQFVGDYQPTRMADSSVEKMQALFAPAIQISATEDGYLTLSGLSREPTKWVEIAPLLFHQVGGQETMAFRADDQGRIRYMFQGNLPIYGYGKLAWYEMLSFQYGLLVVCIALFLSALVVLPIGWLLARRKAVPQPQGLAWACWLAWGTSALYVLFLILFAVSLQDLSQFPTSLTKAALGMALVAMVLTVGMAACSSFAWWQRSWSIIGRSYYTLITLGALGFVWFLSYWNLIGFQW